MTDYNGTVEHRPDATVITPAHDVPAPPPAGFQEKLKAAYERGVLQAAMRSGRVTPKGEPTPEHQCHYWQIGLQRIYESGRAGRRRRVLIKKICTSYQIGDTTFIGCREYTPVFIGPEDQARELFAQIKDSRPRMKVLTDD